MPSKQLRSAWPGMAPSVRSSAKENAERISASEMLRAERNSGRGSDEGAEYTRVGRARAGLANGGCLLAWGMASMQISKFEDERNSPESGLLPCATRRRRPDAAEPEPRRGRGHAIECCRGFLRDESSFENVLTVRCIFLRAGCRGVACGAGLRAKQAARPV